MAETGQQVPTVRIEVLGPVRLWVDDRPVKVGGLRQQRVLATLLLERGRIVPTDVLADRVWGDEEVPEDPAAALRTYVSRLRGALNDAGAPGADVLCTDSPGYRLEVADDGVDEVAFASLVAQGRAAARTGEHDRAVALLGRALDLWRGRPFGDLAGLDWLQPEEVRLDELHATALEEHAASRVAQGVDADLVASLERLVAIDPLRPRPVELLMRALHLADRQRDALRVAAQHRDALAELGLEPAPSLRDLESRIAIADPSLDDGDANLPTVRGFVLRDRVRQGPTTVTYRANQSALDRDVALTRVRAEVADDPGFVRRFEAEVDAVVALDHPAIAPLEDAWREPGAAWLVTPWYPDTLVHRLEHPTEAPIDLVALVTQIGGALATAHAAGVAHRRVRASNVWLDGAGNLHLGDFPVGRGVAASSDGVAIDVAGLAALVAEAATGRKVDAGGADALGSGLAPPVLAALGRALDADPTRRHPGIQDLADELLRALRTTSPPTMEDPWGPPGTRIPAPNPYKGLRAFQESDAEDFHGRGELVDDLLDRLARPGVAGRLLLLVGPSGSGKSSLVRAGVLPAIRAMEDGPLAGAFVSSMIPGRSPFDELAAALARVAVQPTIGLARRLRAPGGLAAALDGLLPDSTSDLVLVVDQLEELYTAAGGDGRAFTAALVEAVRAPASRLRVVGTIRADLWDHPLRDDALAPLVREAAVSITPLTATEVEAAVVEPARRVGVTVEPALAAAVAAEVARGAAALPLLQYALTELFERSSTSGTLTRADFAELGGVAGAVARRADALLDASGPDERAAARALFGRLVTLGDGTPDTRRRVRLAELPGDDATRAVVQRFGAARLLTLDRDPRSREPTVEVAHEALIGAWPRLRTWVDEDRSLLRAQRQLTEAAEAWAAGGSEDADLHRGGRLAADEELVEAGVALNDREAEFVRRSVAHRDAEHHREQRQVRRLRSLLVAAAVAAVVALVGGVVATRSARDADRARAVADVERLRAVAGREVATRPDLAALLAIEAQRLDPSAASLTTLHQVLVEAPSGLVASLPHPDGGTYAPRLLTDGTSLIAAAADGFDIWNPTTRTLERTIDRPGADRALTATAGRLLLAASGEGITIHDLEDGELLTNSMLGLQWRSGATPLRALAGAPDGSAFAEVDVRSPSEVAVTDVGALRRKLESNDPFAEPSSIVDVGVPVTELSLGAASGDLIVGGEGSLRSVDPTTGVVRWELVPPLRRGLDELEGQVGSLPAVTALALTAGGERLAVAWERDLDAPDSRIRASAVVELLDATSGTVEAVAELGGRAERLVWLDEGARQIGTVEDGRTLRAYDLDGVTVETLVPERPNEVDLAVTGEDLLATAGGSAVQLWSRSGAGPLRTTFPVLDAHRTLLATFGGAIVVAVLGDGTIATSHRTEAGTVGRAVGTAATLDDPTTGARRLLDGEVYVSHGAAVVAAGNSGTGFADADGSRRGLRTRSVGDDGSHLGRVAASPDGRYFAIARPGGVVELHGSDGALLGPLRNGSLAPTEATDHLSFSGDGELVVAHQLGGSGQWTIWRTADRDRAAAGSAADLIRPMLVGPLLLASSGDGSVLRLDPRTRDQVARPLVGHACCAVDADLSPDGELLATLGLDVRVWNLATGEQVGAPLPVDRAGNVRWLRRGRRLVVPSADVVTIWDMDVTAWAAAACDFAGRDLTAEEWATVGPRQGDRRSTCDTVT